MNLSRSFPSSYSLTLRKALQKCSRFRAVCGCGRRRPAALPARQFLKKCIQALSHDAFRLSFLIAARCGALCRRCFAF